MPPKTSCARPASNCSWDLEVLAWALGMLQRSLDVTLVRMCESFESDLAQIAHQLEPRRPDYCGIYIADVLTGTYAFGAIMTALYQRRVAAKAR